MLKIFLRILKIDLLLQEAINQALGELREEGKLKEISEKYFGMDITEEEQTPSGN